jgi:crotonobetainyl-CoA:carnitine CoA-transferase CaiB-like acyl-CoA transferase
VSDAPTGAGPPTSAEAVYAARDGEPGALEGIRVVDLTAARAGPTCVRQLADLGAEVVQVAHPSRGDLGGSDAANLHRGKRSIILDLKQDAGREALLRLTDRADVLVENFRTNVKHRLGIGPDTVRARNPRLVYASLSGFGQAGPDADKPAVDPIVQGLAGLMSVTGPPGGGPWRAGIAISDTAAGTFLTQGILAALFARERTGRGQWVHTSLLESLINFMDFQAMRWLVDGVVPPQAGNDHPTLTPMGTFATADGHVTVAAAMDWEAFLDALDDRASFDGDGRFSHPIARIENRDALREAIETQLATRDTAHWIERFQAADLPCGAVRSMDEVFADAQVRALRLTRRVVPERGEPIDVLRHPTTLSDTPTRVTGARPEPGADTLEVLRELGYSAGEIEALLERGAAATDRKSADWTR